MNMLSAPPYEIVRIVDLQPPGETGFCVLIAPPTDADVAANLQKEFASQLSVKLSVIDSRGLSVAALIGELRKLPRGTLLIHGLEDWSNDQF
ncbi:MAG TPA: hypothetical protein VME43_01585, partial [Bryobacteraceae bacterium]|nr:hypothetical protein [Bryobacteraceae bacterium]